MKRLLALAALALCQACVDFHEAEKQYCMHHLDVCGIQQGAHVQDGHPFAANLSGISADPYAPVPPIATGQVQLVYDDQSQSFAWSWSIPAFTPTSVVLVDARGNQLTTLPTPTGYEGMPPATAQLLLDGLATAVATSPAGDVIAGPVAPPGRERLLAALSGWEAVPPHPGGPLAYVALTADFSAQTAHVGIQSDLPGGTYSVGQAWPAFSGSDVLQIPGPGADIALPPQLINDLSIGHLYVVRKADIGGGNLEIRGQLLAPGAALYVVTLTGSQAVPPNATAGVVGQGMMISSADRTSVTSTFSVAGANNVNFSASPAGVEPAQAWSLSTGLSGVAVPPVVATGLPRRTAYVEVPGVARGQFLRPGERIYFATLSGPPPGGTSEHAWMQIVLTAGNTAIVEGAASLTSGVTGAELHGNGNTLDLGISVRPDGSFGAVVPSVPLLPLLAASGASLSVLTTTYPSGEASGGVLTP